MPAVMSWERTGSKICPRHLERLAAVYVRQSTMVQVVRNTESTRLQYGLVDRAVALGWTAARVMVIDDDLGRSAAGGQRRGVRPWGVQRPDFARVEGHDVPGGATPDQAADAGGAGQQGTPRRDGHRAADRLLASPVR